MLSSNYSLFLVASITIAIHLLTTEKWKAEFTWAPSKRAYKRKLFAQGYNSTVVLLGFERAT